MRCNILILIPRRAAIRVNHRIPTTTSVSSIGGRSPSISPARFLKRGKKYCGSGSEDRAISRVKLDDHPGQNILRSDEDQDSSSRATAEVWCRSLPVPAPFPARGWLSFHPLAKARGQSDGQLTVLLPQCLAPRTLQKTELTRELRPPDPRTPAEGRGGGKAEERNFSF